MPGPNAGRRGGVAPPSGTAAARRAGFRGLPGAERGGRTPPAVAAPYPVALGPVPLTASLAGVAGAVYAAGALALGVAFLVPGLALARTHSDASASVTINPTNKTSTPLIFIFQLPIRLRGRFLVFLTVEVPVKLCLEVAILRATPVATCHRRSPSTI